ncbi:MAG: MGH1-like glycoside hydrolase domain-containing protein [Ardenticatenaceae bacterium]
MFYRKFVLLSLALLLLLIGNFSLFFNVLQETEGSSGASELPKSGMIAPKSVSNQRLDSLAARIGASESEAEDLLLPEPSRFFTEGGVGLGGFSVYDDAEANFLSAFEQWDLHFLGYPISRRYRRDDGFVMQAFQKAIMESPPGTNDVTLVNILDDLHQAGKDPFLYDTLQIPYQLPPDWDAERSFDEIVSNRQGLLDDYPVLREAYFASGNPLAIYGLPTSDVEDMGTHLAVRLQRTTLQQWLEDQPWASTGEVTIANSGQIAKQLGMLPAEALLPEEESAHLRLMVPPSEISLPLPKDESTTWHLPMAPDIVAMREMIVNVFQANELEFDVGYPVQGFSPDPIYRRLFIRDTSTLMSGASYFYPDLRLKWGVEGFLHRQYDNSTVSTEDGWQAGFGAIPATVGFDDIIDKASTVSDEETHLIHAAYVVYNTHGGRYWLTKSLTGRANWGDREVNLPIIARLNAAGNWLLTHRGDKGTGLIVRDHTTDWGDVRFQPTQGNPTDIDPTNVIWTASIYDQALAYRAWSELAIMNRAVGYESRAQEWEAEAERLRQATNKHLWQSDRGFYRTHLHITPLEHDFDEDEILSIANAVAIICGMTTPAQEQLIITNLERARVESGAAKPGVVLYPSYPTSFYSLPQMRLASTYQNGGVWDWWGAWQVLAAFQNGRSQLGRTYLSQTAADWVTHPEHIFEWQSVNDLAGAGGDQYTGAAGIYAQVVIEGLYGVDLSLGGLTLSPRLGDWPGRISAHQEVSNIYMRYNYQPFANALILAYETNHQTAYFPLRLLLPAGFTPSQVRLNGTSVGWNTFVVGQDAYLSTALPNGRHQLVVEGTSVQMRSVSNKD